MTRREVEKKRRRKISTWIRLTEAQRGRRNERWSEADKGRNGEEKR